MAFEAAKATAGSGAVLRRPGASPGGPTRARDLQESRRQELREPIMAAMLCACGELGYGQVTVEEVSERYGGHRTQFYRHFTDLGECYEAAYDAAAERLCAEFLQAAAAEPTWRQGLDAALGRLVGFVRKRPATARALLIDVHVAGELTQARRREILHRLARAIDSARAEADACHSPPPPLTAQFLVGAIEASLVSSLVGGDPARLTRAIPELARLASAAYFSADAGAS